MNPEVEVHDGFKKYIFKQGIFDKINYVVMFLLKKYPPYRLIRSKHIIGAADSDIAGAALAHAMPKTQVDV